MSIPERMKSRLKKARPMISVTLRIPLYRVDLIK